jgi:hypothetical protein
VPAEPIPVRVSCGCTAALGRPRIAFYVLPPFLAYLRVHGIRFPEALQSISWRCQKCGQTVRLTAQDLHLAA